MVILTPENIDTAYREDMVIDVWAPWCGPCRRYAKPFEETAARYSGKNLTFAKMNFDDNRKSIDGLVEEGSIVKKIEGIPCTLFIKDGKEVDRLYGIQTDKLEKKINEYYLE